VVRKEKQGKKIPEKAQVEEAKFAQKGQEDSALQKTQKT